MTMEHSLENIIPFLKMAATSMDNYKITDLKKEYSHTEMAPFNKDTS